MAILLYLIAFLFTFGQLGRISFYNQEVNFYLYEIGLVVVLLILLFKYRLKPLKEISRVGLVFFAILVLSLLNDFGNYSLFENVVGFFYLLRLALYGAFLVYVGYGAKKNAQLKTSLRKAVLIITVMTVITTVTQYFLYPDLRNLLYLGWDPHLYRAFGVFFDTAIAASIFGIIFLFSSAPAAKIIYLIFLIFSFSRGNYLALTVSLVYIFWQKKLFKKLFIFLIIFLFLIFIAPKPAGEGAKLSRTFSIVSRFEDYREGLALFLKKPILGYGYNRLRYARGIEDSHAASFSSSYMTILASSGILGLFGLLGLFGEVWKSKKGFRPILLFLAVVSLADNVLLHPFIMFLGGILFILSDS